MADYDVVVIGAGAAGLVASKLTADMGKKTALIENNKIGGNRTWFGCTPGKALIKSAYIAHDTNRLRDFGIEPKQPIELDTSKVMAHVREVVKADAARLSPEKIEALGIKLLLGSPKFIDENSIEINKQKITSKKFIICTGSRPFIPPIAGLDQVDYLTNETIFNLEKLPRSMIILGSGPIGIELAAALNRLGVKITVIHRSGQILKNDDCELVARLRELIEAEGVNIISNATTQRFTRNNGRVAAHIKDSMGLRNIDADFLLVATGRTPNIDKLDLEKAHVHFDTAGIVVDEHLRTTTKHIYAAGDVVPPYLFSHISEYEAVIAATNASLPIPIRKTDYSNILWTTFTEPELAHAGLTEQQARQQYGDNIKIYRWQNKDIDRCRTDLNQAGFSKIICDKKRRILGVHILGQAASEIIHETQLAKSLGIKFSKIASVIHSYPSYSDSIHQPAKRCLIDCIRNNIFIRVLLAITTKRKVRFALAAIAVFISLLFILPIQSWLITMLEWVESLGYWGPIVVICIYIIACVLFLPSWILTVGAGFIFGLFKGTITVSIGGTLGACAAFLVGRTVARKWIETRVKNNPRFAAIDQAVANEGFKIVLLSRLSPIFPYNLLNYAYGLTKVKFSHYALASWIGMLPVTILYVYLGSGIKSLAELKSDDVEIGDEKDYIKIIGLIVTVIVTFLITYIARRALKRAVPPVNNLKNQQE